MLKSVEIKDKMTEVIELYLSRKVFEDFSKTFHACTFTAAMLAVLFTGLQLSKEQLSNTLKTLCFSCLNWKYSLWFNNKEETGQSNTSVGECHVQILWWPKRAQTT